jgi:methyl-accepting chemotaxis protein
VDLARKVGFALGGVVLTTSALSGWTLSQALSSRADVSAYRARVAVVAQAVSDLHADFFGYDGQMNMYVLVAASAPGEGQLIEDTYSQAQASKAQFGKDLATARRLTTDPVLAGALTKIGDSIKGYDSYADTVHAQVQAGRVEEAARTQTTENLEPSDGLMRALTAATSRSTVLAAATLKDLDRRQGAVVASSLTLTGSVLLLLTLIGWYVTRSLRPLRRIEAGLDALAAGDLATRLEIGGTDEVGRMAAAMTRAVTSLHQTMSAVSDNAAALAAASEQLSSNSAVIGSAAADTAERAESMALAARSVNASVNGFSTAADELGASIREIAQNTSQAARVTSSAVDQAQQTSHTVNALGAASAEISGVVDLIQAVAGQTNLLALNATIEAARAGDAGKGFAVVASEVKDLAQQTARATDQISQRIGDIQAQTSAAVEAIAQIGTVVAEVNDYQASIAGAVEEQTATAEQMTRTVNDAAHDSDDITTAIQAVTDAAATTNSSVAEAQHASNELARMSATLHTLVNNFQL